MLSENTTLISCPPFDLFVLVYAYFPTFYAFFYNLFYLQDGRLDTCRVSCLKENHETLRYMYICVYVCMYVYIYIYIHIHTYIESTHENF